MIAARRLLASLVAALTLGIARDVSAQVVPGYGQSIGSLGADRARVDELLGKLAPAKDTAWTGLRAAAIAPSFLLVHNSDIPYTPNDGALWAGRGSNASITGGGELQYRRPGLTLTVTAAPTFAYSQNRAFFFFPDTLGGRSPFSSRLHGYPDPLDLPSRFGDRPVRELSLGQSSIDVAFPNVAVGASSANEWWGPGIQNTLILSNTAAGIPRFYVRTAHPIRTRVGNFEGRLFSGTLTESPYFDTVTTNNYRSISGALLTWRMPFDTGLTLGFARTVYRTASKPTAAFSHPLDALVHWEYMEKTGETVQKADQQFELFFRWVFAPAGVEVYAEWGREEFPRSFHEWLVAPQSTQAYVLGFQNAHQISKHGYLRSQLEFTDLEQSPVYPDRPTIDWYSGLATLQGYTQRGQLLGAAIGPGSSEQFIAVDYLAPAWQAGLFAGRIRWEEDAYFRQPGANTARHDVQIFSGVRAGLRMPAVDFWSELTVARRLNYLFQDLALNAGTPRQAIDIQNVTLTFRIDPRGLPF